MAMQIKHNGTVVAEVVGRANLDAAKVMAQALAEHLNENGTVTMETATSYYTFYAADSVPSGAKVDVFA